MKRNKLKLMEAIRGAMRRLAGHASRNRAGKNNAGEMLLI